MLGTNSSKSKEELSESGIEQQMELLRLQRQLRYLSGDRKAYRNETENVLKRQNHAIAMLLQEESDLMKDMRLVTQRSNEKADKENLLKLSNLLDEEEHTKMALNEERKQLKSYMESITEQQRKTEMLERDMKDGLNDQEKYKEAQKKIHTMENRLNQITVKFNDILAKNACHRRSIQYITVQRSRFTDLYDKLYKVHHQGMKEKNQLIEVSKALYVSREEAEHRMKYLKEKAERDLASFNSELKDLVRIIDHDTKLQEFMTRKELDLSDVYDKAVQARREKKSGDYLKMLQSEVEHYTEIFKRLIEASGDSNVGEMVKSFIETEDMNFALFNYVNEQNMERKQLQAEIEALRVEIESLGNINSTLSKERRAILKEMEEKFDRFSQQRIINKKTHKQAFKTLEQAKQWTWKIFNKISCDSKGINQMLGNSEITMENMVQFLGVIERKVSEILQIKLLIALKENNEHEITQLHAAWTGQHGKKPKTPHLPPSVLIENLEEIRTQDAYRDTNRGQRDHTLKPLHEEETLSTAARSISRLALNTMTKK